MVKFILIVITIVFVGLAYYVNIDKDAASTKTVVKEVAATPPAEDPLKEVQKDVSQDTSFEKTKVVKESSIKKSTKTVEKSVVKSNNKIGEGLTFEGIENADVSQMEKDIMIADKLYYQDKNNEEDTGVDVEESEALIKKDIEEGLVP